MKNLTLVIAENKDIQIELKNFCLWIKEGRNDQLFCSGSLKECESENSENELDGEITTNKIIDQWENVVELIGYVKFSNGQVIDYSIKLPSWYSGEGFYEAMGNGMYLKLDKSEAEFIEDEFGNTVCKKISDSKPNDDVSFLNNKTILELL